MTRTDATRPHPAAPPGVSSGKPFRRLWIALSLSGLGHWLSVPALTAAAGVLARDEDLAGRAQAVGGVLVLLLLPAVLLAPLAGPVTARLDRRLAMLVADLLRFALLLSVPLVDALPWTLGVAFLVACLTLLWAPAVAGSVATLVPEDGAAGARRSALRGALGSAPVAAVLFTVLALLGDAVSGAAEQADLALFGTAAVFLAAGAAAAALREVSGPAPDGAPGGPAGSGTVGSDTVGSDTVGSDTVGAPLKLIFRGPRTADGASAARGMGLALAGAALASAAVVAVARVYARDLGGGDAGYGCVLAGLAIGLPSGMFLGPRVLGPFSRRRLAGLAVVAAASALAVVGLVQNLVVVVFVTAFLGVAAGIAWSASTSALRTGDGHGAADEAANGAAGAGARAYLRSVVLVGALVAVAAVPPLAGLLGTHRIEVGDGVYDFGGAGAALLIVAALTLVAGLVAYRRLDDRRGVPLPADLAAALQGHVYVPPAEAAAAAAAAAAVQPAKRERGVFVAFEGGEGAGKTTQARLAAIWLRDHGYDVITTHEPGATKIGMRLRAMLLDRDTTGLSTRAETLLYAADRADHVANVIRPAMERGAIVVSDRYVDSSLAYQGFGRQQPVEDIARVNAWATGGLIPDLTVLLEMPPEGGLGRIASPPDRMESEPREFHERVVAGFRALAEAYPDRYLVLDAGRPQSELSREIQYRIREILPDPIPAGTEDITSTFPAITDG